MFRPTAFWLALPALICAAATSAYAISPDSQAYVRQLGDRNRDKAQRIQQRLAGIEGQQTGAEERAKAKDDFLKAEIEKAEADEKIAAQFGGPEGQATARDITAILKALREQERWEAARGGRDADAPNRAHQILRDGAGQAAVDRQVQYKTEIETRNRQMSADAALDDMRIMREYEEQEAKKKAEEEQRRRQSRVPQPQAQNDWDFALRYAGEFSGFRIASGPGYLGEERVGTTNRRLGLLKPDVTTEGELRSTLNFTWNLSEAVEPLRLWSATAPAATWMSLGGQYADYSRKSSRDFFDVGPDHRILIPGTGDEFSPDREGFSIGPGGGFNLVRDIYFHEDSEAWSAWGKFGQTCDYGSFTLSGYAMAAYSQIDTRQVFGGRLPNVPPSLDFRYDTHVDTGVGSFGLGLQAEAPIDDLLGRSTGSNNLSIYGGAAITADFVSSSGRDHLRVERPGAFTSTQFVDMRETGVEAGYDLTLGLKYKLDQNWTIDLGGRYGSHQTGIGIERLGTEPSRIEHLRAENWGVGAGLTWRN